MLAIYHLAKHLREGGDPRSLAGVAPLLDGLGDIELPKPKIAVFVGSSKGTDVSLKLEGWPAVHTLWGYIAWRLAGEAGLKLIAEAEAARTNPGSELLVEVFRLAGPSVILLDELVAFARQLPDDRFEAFLSFIQSLTEAAKMVPGVLVVGSLPESACRGRRRQRRAGAAAAWRRCSAACSRSWLPASGDETYEIIRRRLFQPLDADGERARDETVKAFHDLYRKNAAEFPPEAKEARYLELLRLSYPIHPELFDRLSKDWASFEIPAHARRAALHGERRRRAVARADADPLITPARVPVAHERVRASVLYPLDPGFAAVVDQRGRRRRLAAGADGGQSIAAHFADAGGDARRARGVPVHGAHWSGKPNAGLTGQGLRLACAEPGDQLAIFGEALRELSERAAYLYEEAGRYWFSTQPTLNRLAEDRAKALPRSAA